jgi:hypothetical protein
MMHLYVIKVAVLIRFSSWDEGPVDVWNDAISNHSSVVNGFDCTASSNLSSTIVVQQAGNSK